jgi:hypothetical protein
MNWQTQICSLLFRRNKIEPPLQKSGWHLILQAVSSEPSLALDRVHFSGPVHELVLGHG